MDSLAETEKKRERKLKARGLIEKTLEDEINERRNAKKQFLYDKTSIKSISFSDSIDQAHHFNQNNEKKNSSYRLPKLIAN